MLSGILITLDICYNVEYPFKHAENKEYKIITL